nr:uncharacterized protein LOC112273107 isoform X2 [Physcomitrium patens]|eukprot:XP_024357275.1 uncharacterized protein LOC112273107 isoform X2 [Physcomitrella patens]
MKKNSWLVTVDLNVFHPTARFCHYPQEIVLELQWPSRIINMQLLSHEFKIPTKVEVFVGLIVPYVYEAVGQMKRLGYLALDCNERSGHQARELKGVYIDSPATVVRLVFHNCHVNNFNVYNQVGLMALILTGEPLDEQQWTLLTQPGFEDLLQTPRRRGVWNSKVPEMMMQRRRSPERRGDTDSSTASRILQLQEEKNSAVLSEDYDEAKRLKGLIDRLKIIGEEIKQLENKKQLAVEDEDYDTAKTCKEEIEKLHVQELLPDRQLAQKVDVVSDCGISSEESVDEVHAAEGCSSEEAGHEDSAGTSCGDSDKKEFGTQTLHPAQNTVVKKLDKEISCRTPDLRPPPNYQSLLPAITSSNMLSDATRDDTYVHVLPTVSYKHGSSALLPVLAVPMCHSKGAHPSFTQLNNPSTVISMALNNYPSKQPLLAQPPLPPSGKHPRAFLKALSTFYNHNGEPANNTSLGSAPLYQNPASPFSTSTFKNMLTPMMQASLCKQAINPVKDENGEHKAPNLCEIPNAYVDNQQSSEIQGRVIGSLEDHSRVQSYGQQNLNVCFGALVKEYNDSRNMAEQMSKLQQKNQQVLNTRFGALVREFNEAKKIVANGKKQNHVDNSDQQIVKKLNHGGEMNNECEGGQIYSSKNNHFYHGNCEEIDEQMPTAFVNGNRQLPIPLNSKDMLRRQISVYDQVQDFQNDNQVSKIYSNFRNEIKCVKNEEHISSMQRKNCDQEKTFEVDDYVMESQDNEPEEMSQNNERMFRIQTSDPNQIDSFQSVEQMPQVGGDLNDETQSLQSNDDEKLNMIGDLGGLNDLITSTLEEPTDQKKSVVLSKMEKNHQKKVKLDAYDDEQNSKNGSQQKKTLQIKNQNTYQQLLKDQEDEVLFEAKKKLIKFQKDENKQEKNDTSINLQTKKYTTRKQNQGDQVLSPKKPHMTIGERIAQAAKQALDDLVPEPLNESQLSESAPLLKMIDMYYVQCFYSKEWKLRDKAFQYMIQKIKNEQINGDSLDVFRVLSKVILKGLNDKVSNIFNIALQMARVFILRYASGIPGSDLKNCANDFTNLLLEKLGDSNPRTKDAATEALMFLATKKEIGLPFIAISLLKPPKNQTIWRPILGRLQLILMAIPIFGLHPPNKLGLQTEPLMSFIHQAFKNANGDVRNTAVKVTTEVYKHMGSPIEKYLKNVKPVVREVLTKNFEKIAQEAQNKEENVFKDETLLNVRTPPICCNPKMMEMNHDDKCVGYSKKSKKIIRKTTTNSPNINENKIEIHAIGEDTTSSIYEDASMDSISRGKDHCKKSVQKKSKREV